MPEKINSEIIKNYDLFKKVRNSLKLINSERIILRGDSNHKVGEIGMESVFHQDVAEMHLTIKADKLIVSRYQFQLRSPDICQKPFFRLDVSGVTHRNKRPDTPLIKQPIETPHFQCYDEFGINMAYQTEDLKNPITVEKIRKNINYGMLLFCEESITFASERKPPYIIRNENTLFIDEDIDPLYNVFN